MNNRPAGTPDPGKKRNIPPADNRIKKSAGTVRARSTPKPSKPALSPREAAILAEQKRLENLRKRKALKEFSEKFRAVMVFALIGAILSLAVIFGYVYFNFNSKEKLPDEKVRIILSDDKTKVLDEGSYFYRDGQYYVSLSKVCDIAGLTLHGDTQCMSVSFSDSSYASFSTGTNVVRAAGMNCVMTGKSYFEYGQMFIPCSFFSDYCYGISTVHQENGKNKGYNITFDKDFGLKAKTSSENYPNAVANSNSSAVSSDDNLIPVFKSNLSAYEMYMNPQDSDEFLTLITASSPLSADYVPDDLIDIKYTKNDGRDTQKLRLYAAMALEAMFIEMRAQGFGDVFVTSGYREHDDKALGSSAEHQSGLCADLHNLYTESEAFAQKEAYKWLYTHCADFGFILRYPKDKTAITGVSFEPWHYRYVGRHHARKIMESGLCLEEYLA